MQTTFELNANEIDNNLFEAIKKVFKNKPIKITITESTDNKQTLTPKEQWQRMVDLQKKYPPKVISKDIDLSALANEVNA
jgi:hypothetical protein